MGQIPLNIALADTASFDTFYERGNELTIAALKSIPAPGIWIYGPRSSGKSHLLQAATEAAGGAYLSLAALDAPAALDNFAAYPCLALDDIDHVLGHEDWEQALVTVYNLVHSRQGRFIVSTVGVPQDVQPQLPDLQSRLKSLAVFRLAGLGDEGKLAALTMRAQQRGLTPDDNAIRYLIERTERDMGALYQRLCELDRASWVTGRRLTLPFVRDFLSGVASEPQESIEKS